MRVITSVFDLSRKKSTATIDVTRCNAGLLLRWFVIEFSSSSPARGLKAVVNLASSTYRGDNGFYKRINSGANMCCNSICLFLFRVTFFS